MDFDQLRAFLQCTDEGSVLDSLFCVECGLDVYSTYWQAHLDLNEEVPLEKVMETFLSSMIDVLDCDDDAFVKVLGESFLDD